MCVVYDVYVCGMCTRFVQVCVVYMCVRVVCMCIVYVHGVYRCVWCICLCMCLVCMYVVYVYVVHSVCVISRIRFHLLTGDLVFHLQ